MLHTQKIVVVMPAYNAERTLQRTIEDLPDIVDHIIVVDDYSSDNTKKIAESLAVEYIRHEANLGYGGNQKTCYEKALAAGGDIIVMVHPDYQYTPKLVTAMAAMLTSGHYDVILASRMIGNQDSRKKQMPTWRYVANLALTFVENVILWEKLSEYHTGYRAFTKTVLEKIPFEDNSNGFGFDNQILAQAIYHNFKIGEISCPTSYHPEASSINFVKSTLYGLEVLRTACEYRLDKLGIIESRLFRRTK